MNSLDTRRSIRKYSKRDVSDDMLQRMLASAEHTQTMGNLQLYSVVVTRSEELKRRMAPAHFNQPMVTEAPVVLTFCADFRRTTVWAENRKNTGIRQFPFVHKRRHGCASLLSDILQHCRRTGSRLLLSGHDDIRPAGNHRHSKAAAARHAGGNDNPRMARRESVRIRQSAPKSHSSQGDIP